MQTRVLHRACEKLGGVTQLAAFLNAPAAAVYGWLEGESTPPTAVFLKAVDLVMPAWTAEDEMAARDRMRGRTPLPGRKKS